MKARFFVAPLIAALCLPSAVVHSDESDTSQKPKILVIEVPPDGLDTRLPLNPKKHMALRFNAPVLILVDNLQGARTNQIDPYRVDVWPDAALANRRGEAPVQSVPLGGDLSFEVMNRTIAFEVHEPKDLNKAPGAALVRAISHELIALRKERAMAKADLVKARADETASRAREAKATEAARMAEAEAVAAQKIVASAKNAAARERAKAVKAKADARAARAEAAAAQAETAKARAETEAARARAREAAAKEKEAREREMAALEEARKVKEQTLHQMLVAGARDMSRERVQRQVPARGAARAISGRLNAKFRYSDWKNGYFLFDAEFEVTPGRPFALSKAQVTVSGRTLETRIVEPGAPEDPAAGIITTIHPHTPKRIAFAVRVPADLTERPLKLALLERGSTKPPVTFLVPRYDDIAVALMVAIPAEEEQRRRWAKQVVIGPRFSLGGCWLSSGLEGDDDLDATRCTAIGAYAYKGIHDVLTVGVEGLGAWSGNAKFDRDPDDITRSANLFQLMAFADVRLSRGKYVPYLRVGGGGLVASYDDDSDTEFVPFYALGGGFLYRLGEHFNIAAGGCMVAGDGKPRSLQIDLRVGYGWNP